MVSSYATNSNWMRTSVLESGGTEIVLIIIGLKTIYDSSLYENTPIGINENINIKMITESKCLNKIMFLKGKMKMNIAVILAGGTGQRLGLNKPKQFLKVAGKTILEHTVEVFQNHNKIDEIVIVMHENYVQLAEEMVLKNYWTKVKKILKGGSERYESSLVAIQAYANKDGNNTKLIFHDAVRPLVSKGIIDDTIKALEHFDAVDVAIPSADTIIQLKKDIREIQCIPNRSLLNRGQTPQGFRLATIRKAYEIALDDPNFSTTDDCGIVVKYLPNTPVYVVDGDEKNIKLTHPEDIYMLDKLFQLKNSRIDASTELSKLRGQVIVIFGGNSGIGENMADIASQYGAHVYPFSRSLNGVDITEISSVNKALKSVHVKEKKIDYVVNTAAILNKEPIMHLSDADISKIININYYGMVNTSRASFEFLRESKGQLLHFTSSSYTRGRAFYCLYSSTKAAVVNFVQALAEEWSEYGIKVNCINPQRTKTPMRIANFGLEDEKTLLKSEDVAIVSLQTLLSDFNGEIVDIKVKPV